MRASIFGFTSITACVKGGARLLGRERAVLDLGVEPLEIGARDRGPELFPCSRLDARGDEVDEDFLVAGLLPEAEHEHERLVDVELPERIAEIDGRAVFHAFRLAGTPPWSWFTAAGMSHFWV